MGIDREKAREPETLSGTVERSRGNGVMSAEGNRSRGGASEAYRNAELEAMLLITQIWWTLNQLWASFVGLIIFKLRD